MNDVDDDAGDTEAASALISDRFISLLQQRFAPGIAAILMYGSWLRGKRDTILDFYVLLDDYDAFDKPVHAWANRALAPNVYHVTTQSDGKQYAAKYATLTLSALEKANRHAFHSYFWARFAQPMTLVYAQDSATAARVPQTLQDAGKRMTNEKEA